MSNHPKPADSEFAAPIWKRRFYTSAIMKTRLASQDPTRGLAIVKDAESHHLSAWDVSTKQLRKLVEFRDGWLAPDAGYVYFLRDHKGSELGHLARVPYRGGDIEDLTPDFPDYTLRGFDISQDGSKIAFDAVMPDGYQYFIIDIDQSGAASPSRLLYQNKAETWEAILSFGGEILVVKTSAAGEKRRYSLLAVDTETGALVGSLSYGAQHNTEPVAFAPLTGDFRLLATTTNDAGLKRPVIWNPRTDERTLLHLAYLEGEIEPLDWSPDGTHILLRQTYLAEHQLYLYELATEEVTRLDHPPGVISGSGGMYHCGQSATYFGPEGRIWANWQNAGNPPQLIALDVEMGEQVGTLLATEESLPARSMRSITYRSSDGQEIQGWLGVPEGDGPFPTILNMHGGPHGTMTDSYSTSIQSWLEHGFAYLTINFRGSVGFGLEFRAKIEGWFRIRFTLLIHRQKSI
ncbi:acetylxylan esterase [Chloroflexi bacterium TSY]|nr:acetylxylan esterase [Chloroflexi bacterium TSY]